MKLGFFSVAILTGAKVQGLLLDSSTTRGHFPKPGNLVQADSDDVKVEILPHYGHPGQTLFAPDAPSAPAHTIPQKVRVPNENLGEEKALAKDTKAKAAKAKAEADKAIAASKFAKHQAHKAERKVKLDGTKVINANDGNQETCSGNSCAGCAHLRDDMTHIAVATETNQLVTIDMPMSEAKRITVK